MNRSFERWILRAMLGGASLLCPPLLHSIASGSAVADHRCRRPRMWGCRACARSPQRSWAMAPSGSGKVSRDRARGALVPRSALAGAARYRSARARARQAPAPYGPPCEPESEPIVTADLADGAASEAAACDIVALTDLDAASEAGEERRAARAPRASGHTFDLEHRPHFQHPIDARLDSTLVVGPTGDRSSFVDVRLSSLSL